MFCCQNGLGRTWTQDCLTIRRADRQILDLLIQWSLDQGDGYRIVFGYGELRNKESAVLDSVKCDSKMHMVLRSSFCLRYCSTHTHRALASSWRSFRFITAILIEVMYKRRHKSVYAPVVQGWCAPTRKQVEVDLRTDEIIPASTVRANYNHNPKA